MGRGQELLNLVKSIKQEKELQTVQEEIKEVIKPENLKAGVTAFGIEGNKNIVDTTDANMDYYGAKMLAGYNAYAQGRKVSGTMKSTKKDNLSYFAGTTKIINPENPDFILTKQFPSGTIKGAIKKISANAIDPTWIEDKNICIRANYNPSLTYWPKDWHVEIAVCNKDHYFYFKSSSGEQPIYCCDASRVGQPYVLYNAFVDDLNDLTIDLWTKTEVAVSNYMNSNLGKIGTLYAYSRNKSLSTNGLTGSSGVPGSKNKLYIQKEVGANTEAAYVSNDYNSAYLDQLDESVIANAINLKPENVKKGETYLGVEGTMEAGIDTSDATAKAEDIIINKTAYINGEKITGTLSRSYGSTSIVYSDNIEVPEGLTLRFTKNFDEACAFPKGSYLILQADIDSLRNAIGLTADKIKEGDAILAVEGTAKTTNAKITSGYYLFYQGLRTDCLYELLSLCENITSARNMFYDCQNLTELDLSNLDTSNASSMRSMFYNCQNLAELNLSNLDTNNVSDMEYMFYNCCNLTELDLSSFNTSNVTNMHAIFSGCNRLTSLDLSNFDTNKVTTMQNMFSSCGNLTELNLSSFNTNNVTNMNSMFNFCEHLTKLDIRNFTFDNVQDYQNIFYRIPTNCLIIVKGDTEKEWVLTQRSDFTNVKTIAELGA